MIGGSARLEQRGTGDIEETLRGSAAERASAFSHLLDRSLDRSYRIAAVIIGDREEAEDATHDAVLRAWRNVASLRDPERFDAWFQRILVNVCRNRLRARRRGAVREIGLGRSVDEESSSIERDALRRAIAELSPDHGTVIALRYLEDLTVEQIADRTGARPGTVKSRLHYALRELRAAYDAAGRESRGTIR